MMTNLPMNKFLKIIENNITYDLFQLRGSNHFYFEGTAIIHRIDWKDGSSWYYFDDKKVASKEEYEKLERLKAFI